MPKISQIDVVPCQAEVRILQKITLKEHTLLVRQPAVLIVCKRVYKSFLKEFKTSKGKMSFYVTRF